MLQHEIITQAIDKLETNTHFTVNDIFEAVKQHSITRKNLMNRISYLVARGKIHRIQRGGAGRVAIYSKAKIESAPKQQPLPMDLPLEKVGEALLVYTQLLKAQIRKAEENGEALNRRIVELNKANHELKKTLDQRSSELEEIRQAINTKTGKTFPMSEVVRVIRNGKLIHGTQT